MLLLDVGRAVFIVREWIDIVGIFVFVYCCLVYGVNIMLVGNDDWEEFLLEFWFYCLFVIG